MIVKRYPWWKNFNFRALKWYFKRQQCTMSDSGKLSRVSSPMPPKVMKCNYCEKCLSQSWSCMHHELTHTGEKPYQSSTCKWHEITHTGVKLYQCKYCDKCYRHSTNCKVHERTHTGVTPYQCKYCDKCFRPVSYTHLTLPTIYSV